MSKIIKSFAGALLLLSTVALQAADHLDSPGNVADPAADLTDVFAWTTPTAAEVNLIIGIPAAQFSNAVQYVINVESSSAYGRPGTQVQIICQFAVNQSVECWAGGFDYLQGNASATTGLRSLTGRMLAFVGRRNDPFFFNGPGLRRTLDIVAAAAPGLTFDTAGCPILNVATSNSLIAELQRGGDSFALGSPSFLVLQVDKSLVAPGGNILAVFATTHRS